MIQNDRDLMGKYLHVVEENTSLAYVNSEIAKEIKSRFDLENIGRNENPDSFLIQGYEKFKTQH